MQTEIKILKSMIENKKEMTIREISLFLKLDYKIVHTACKRLSDKKIISMKTIGKSKQLSLINKLSREIFEAEFERREEILRNKNLKVLLEDLQKSLSSVNYFLLLFGSHAKRRANDKSDIDLMFITSSRETEKEAERAVSLLPLKIHYIIFTEEQFNKMKDAREINVVKEAIKNNVILYGIEPYYSILSK
jgi:predicted nucleotidyltransferase